MLEPKNLVTACLFNVLTTLPTPQPKIITISSTGLTKKSHATLPLPMKPLYGYFLALPHKDKVGAERAVSHCAGWEWDVKGEGEPGEDIMGPNWRELEGLPAPGTLKNIVVIRPAFLTDNEPHAENPCKKPYRVSEDDIGGWIIGRKDVAHFLVEGILGHWDTYRGKCMSIAY